MAKKISEKELNNVSGGCGETYFYYKLYTYNKNNEKIGGPFESEHCPSAFTADRKLTDKLRELFLNDSTIAYIKWESVGYNPKEEATVYREPFLS